MKAIFLSLIVLSSANADLISLPSDFSTNQGTNGIYYESIGDGRPTNTANPSFAASSLMIYQGILSGDFANRPTYSYSSSNLYPFIQMESIDNYMLLHPGTGGVTGNANIGSTIRYQSNTNGAFNIVGSFARQNPNTGYGDGVDVIVVKNDALASPLFSGFISQNHVVTSSDPFLGTGVQSFNFNVTLQPSDSIRFIVFAGAQGQDGTFDGTALRVSINTVPEPTSAILLAITLPICAFRRIRPCQQMW